jgi:hypothetical protein
MKTFRVEIVENKTGKIVSIIGTGLTEERAEKREMTGLMRIDTNNYFVRTVVERKRKLNCNNCRKCGETICGNDTEDLRCFEPK